MTVLRPLPHQAPERVPSPHSDVLLLSGNLVCSNLGPAMVGGSCLYFLLVYLFASGLALASDERPSVKAAPRVVGTTESLVRVVERHETYTTGQGRCAVDVAYPEVAGLSSFETLESVNRLVQQAVMATIPESCRAPRDASPVRKGEGCADLPDPGKTDVSVGYSSGLVKDGLLSIRVLRTACTNPSLHPDERVEGLTVNLETGTTYQMADLFRPGTPWQETLTQAVREKLSATAKMGPDVTISVRRFFLKEGALVVLRPVSARALHPLEVEVPLKRLQPMLRADLPGLGAER